MKSQLTVRKGFTGYERDGETNLDFAQARYFDSGFGRFSSPDDFVNDTLLLDPQSWNLFVYVRNNPLALVDPSGKEIQLCQLDKNGGCSPLSDENKAEFLKRVNYTYGCSNCTSIDSQGRLQVDTSGLSKEIKEATQYLTDAINAPASSYFALTVISNGDDSISFGKSGTATVGSGKDKKTVNAIMLDLKDHNALIGSDDLKKAFDFTTFAHEVRHQYPEATNDPEFGRSTGKVVDAVNKILYALGQPLRATYFEERSEGTTAFGAVYFGSAQMKNGKIQYNKDNGIRVNADSKKLLQWNKLWLGESIDREVIMTLPNFLFLFVAAASLLSSQGFSQDMSGKKSDDYLYNEIVTVRGRVTASQSGKKDFAVRANAYLILQRTDCKKCLVGVNADENGNYEIKVSQGKYRLIVREGTREGEMYNILAPNQPRYLEVKTPVTGYFIEFNVSLVYPINSPVFEVKPSL